MKPVGHEQRRYERFEVRLPTEVRGADGVSTATLVDVSEGGAAVRATGTHYSNDAFVELHTEGYETLHGRVVREFSDGFALEFDDEEERQRARDEIAKFKAIIGERREF